MDDMPADLKELYAQYGMAAETAQVLEVEVGNYALAYLAMFVTPGDVSPEETDVFRAVLKDLNRKTLGAMLRQLKGMATISPDIIEILDKALERRNYLAHRFFPAHNFAIQSPVGRAAMLEDLENVHADLRRGHQYMSAMTDGLNKIAGHGEGLAATVEKFVKRGKRIDI